MLVLGLRNGTPSEVHQLLKTGGDVVRPEVSDVQGLAEMAALFRVRYVDAGTSVPVAEQTGSIAKPFSTMAAALTSLQSIGGGVIRAAPGVYTNTVVPGGVVTAICGYVQTLDGEGQVFLNGLTSTAADVTLQNVRASNVALASRRLLARACRFEGTLTCGTASDFVACNVPNITATGSVQLSECTLPTAGSFASVTFRDCSVGGTVVTTGNLAATFTSFGNAVTVGGTANVRNCTLALSLAVTGALTADYDSIASVLATMSFASFTLATQTPKITVSVVVPAVAAGQVGYVDVSLVGTGLAGLVPVGSLLCANPTADLVAAGAGGGFVNVRASAANTARFAFLGPLAGGASNFVLGVL